VAGRVLCARTDGEITACGGRTRSVRCRWRVACRSSVALAGVSRSIYESAVPGRARERRASDKRLCEESGISNRPRAGRCLLAAGPEGPSGPRVARTGCSSWNLPARTYCRDWGIEAWSTAVGGYPRSREGATRRARLRALMAIRPSVAEFRIGSLTNEVTREIGDASDAGSAKPPTPTGPG
jgi:hypothetical protein